MIGVDTCSDTKTTSDGFEFENFLSFLSSTPDDTPKPKQSSKNDAVDDAPKLSSKKEEASKSDIPSKAVGEEKALERAPDLEAGTQTPSTKPDPFLLKAFQDADTDGDGHLSREELKVS
jgi:hypothetical protein